MTKRAHLLNLTLSVGVPHAPEASDAPDAHLNGHDRYLTELDLIWGWLVNEPIADRAKLNAYLF